MVDALQVLVLKRLYIFSLEHLLSLFLSCQVVKVAIKTLSQSLGKVLILGIVSDELWCRFCTHRGLVYLGGLGDGGHIHCQVLAIESAAEGTRTRVGRGGSHYAEVSQCSLDVGGRRDETSRDSFIWLGTQCSNLLCTGIFNEIWCFNEPPYKVSSNGDTYLRSL